MTKKALKNPCVIAVGGVRNDKTETINVNEKKIKVYKCRWSRLQRVIKDQHKSCKKNHVCFILRDILQLMERFGYMAGEEMHSLPHNKRIRPESVRAFSKLRKAEFPST